MDPFLLLTVRGAEKNTGTDGMSTPPPLLPEKRKPNNFGTPKWKLDNMYKTYTEKVQRPLCSLPPPPPPLLLKRSFTVSKPLKICKERMTRGCWRNGRMHGSSDTHVTFDF